MNIIVIEDNIADYELLKFAINSNEYNITLNFNHYETGEEGLNYIFENIYKCDLIILDINLPGISGLEVLRKIKNTEETKHIPIIVYSTNENKEDIKKSYKLMANSYILKTFELNNLLEIMKNIIEYWGNNVELPPKTNRSI